MRRQESHQRTGLGEALESRSRAPNAPSPKNLSRGALTRVRRNVSVPECAGTIPSKRNRVTTKTALCTKCHRRLAGTDCHTSDIGHWFAMTGERTTDVSPSKLPLSFRGAKRRGNPHLLEVPTWPEVYSGERIATPVCALVRNDNQKRSAQ